MFIHFVKSLAKKLSVFWFKLRQRGMLSSGRDCLLAGCKVKAAGGNRGNKVALGDSVSLRKCVFILNGGVTELPLLMERSSGAWFSGWKAMEMRYASAQAQALRTIAR